MINEILTGLCKKLKVKKKDLNQPNSKKQFKTMHVFDLTISDLTLEYDRDPGVFETVGLKYFEERVDVDATSLGDQYQLEIRIDHEHKSKLYDFVGKLSSKNTLIERIKKDFGKMRGNISYGNELFVAFEQGEEKYVVNFMYDVFMYIDKKIQEELGEEPKPEAKSHPFRSGKPKKKKTGPGPDHERNLPPETFEEQ